MPRQKHESSEEMMSMLASIDIHSSVAVYVQIENHVQFAIAAGRLSAGDQLPSVRELSERLEVNPNTVAKAYRDLEVMGLLYTRRGMGVFVNKGIDVKCREESRKRIISRIHEVIAEAKAAGLTNKEINEVVGMCLAHQGTPYTEAPQSLLQMAKATKKKK